MEDYEKYREFYEYCENLLNIDITLNLTNINKKENYEPKSILVPKKNQFNNIPLNNNNQDLKNFEDDDEIKDDVPKIQK